MFKIPLCSDGTLVKVITSYGKDISFKFHYVQMKPAMLLEIDGKQMWLFKFHYVQMKPAEFKTRKQDSNTICLNSTMFR